MNEFKRYHPIVTFLYFLCTIGFAMFFSHPVCLLISFVSSLAYSVVLKGKRALKTNFLYMLPLIFLTALINAAFNHEGITVLTYLPSGNPLTLESMLYGVFAAFMIITVIGWFSCFNEIMTSDKFIYLFGKISPALSLVFSMTLRFVPRFISQLKAVAAARKCAGCDLAHGSVIRRAKNGLSVLSATVTWALENSVDTADSMKARGYGLSGRTAFSIYIFSKRDLISLVLIFTLSVYVLVGRVFGAGYFSFFPKLQGTTISAFGISVYIAYFALCALPIIIELMEVSRWKQLK